MSRHAHEQVALQKGRELARHISVFQHRIAIPLALYPTTSQKAILKQAMGTIRWTYNRCVAIIKDNPNSANVTTLRAQAVNATALEDFPWASQTPARVREDAMMDAIDAFKVARRRQRAGNLPRFRLRYRRRRSGFGAIKIQKNEWRLDGLYPRLWPGFGSLRSAEPLPPQLQAAAILTLREHKWYLKVTTEGTAPRAAAGPRVIAIDPSIYTFLTMFSPTSAQVWKWGAGDGQRLFRLLLGIDELHAKMALARCRRRWRLRRAESKAWRRIRNLVDNVHNRAANFLAANFDVVLLPSLNYHQMSRRGARRISRATVRKFAIWAHGRFRRTLGHKMEYITVPEHHTSKTCSGCGWYHTRIGGARVFKCRVCGMQADRDANAAKNIFLRFVHDSVMAFPEE
ncbi:hypothetical protein V8E36_004162 [Tilletia maclaganii]